MATGRVIAPSDYRVMPWRNGQGSTTEIAVAPAEGATDRFRWRLSIADVGRSGPFSDFAGYDRVIAVVAGAGMRLAVAGCAPVRLDQQSDPYGFSGDAATVCALLAGPIRDFNLMTDRATVRGGVRALRTGLHHVTLAGGIALLHDVRGPLVAHHGVCGRVSVPEAATLRLDSAVGALQIEVQDYALLATIIDL